MGRSPEIPKRPERGLRGGAGDDLRRRGAQPGVVAHHHTAQPLEVGGVGMGDAKMAQLDLCLRPGQRRRAGEGRGSRCRSTRSRSASGVSATIVQKVTRVVPPAGTRTLRRIEKIGSSTVPWSPTAAGHHGPLWRCFSPRPMKRARSVSIWIGAVSSPSTTAIWAAQTSGSCGERRRRVAMMTPSSGR
jgi:hypothetical protein